MGSRKRKGGGALRHPRTRACRWAGIPTSPGERTGHLATPAKERGHACHSARCTQPVLSGQALASGPLVSRGVEPGRRLATLPVTGRATDQNPTRNPEGHQQPYPKRGGGEGEGQRIPLPRRVVLGQGGAYWKCWDTGVRIGIGIGGRAPPNGAQACCPPGPSRTCSAGDRAIAALRPTWSTLNTHRPQLVLLQNRSSDEII